MNKENIKTRIEALKAELQGLENELTRPRLPQKWEDFVSDGQYHNTKSDSVYVVAKGVIRVKSKYFCLHLSIPYWRTKSEAYRYGVLLPQLLQLRRVYIDSVEEGWEADWSDNRMGKYTIARMQDYLHIEFYMDSYKIFSFPTTEIRDKFLEVFRPQLRIFLELDPIHENV